MSHAGLSIRKVRQSSENLLIAYEHSFDEMLRMTLMLILHVLLLFSTIQGGEL